MVDMSGRGAAVVVDVAVAPDTAVKIEMQDSLMLGEVCYCRAEAGEYVIGIQVQQVLHGLRDLAALNSRLVEGWRGRAGSPELTENQRAARTRYEDRELRQGASAGR